MDRVAFKMKLLEGKEGEYKRRHDEIWPELRLLLKEASISEYSIFLDEGTMELFGCYVVGDKSKVEALAGEPLMRKWWEYMKDIMETNADNSPKTFPLAEVFYLK